MLILQGSNAEAKFLTLGLKVPFGLGVYVASEDSFALTQFGVGGYIQPAYKFIGIELDFMYGREGSWSISAPKSVGIEPYNAFKFHILPKLIAGGFSLGVGPEIITANDNTDVILDFVISNEISIADAVKISIDFPKVGTNFWDDDKFFDIQLRIGVGISIL